MNIFLTHFIVVTLLLFQGIQAQIRILITAEDNSNGKEKRHLTLTCRVTDTTDVHIKCQNLWWTREIDHYVHREVVIGHRNQKSFKTGYKTELKVQPPRELPKEVYSCHALCGLQTFVATCHLGDLRNSMIECSSHFMESYQRSKMKNESKEIYEMKKTLSIGTPLFLIMLVSLLIMAVRKFWKMYKKRKMPPEEIVEVIEKDDHKKEEISNEDVPQKIESKTEEALDHKRPSIMLNGELIMDGDTPFAKVVRNSNNKSVVSFVQDMRALQNWDPGVSCFTLTESEDDGEEEEVGDFERENLLVPDNDCYAKNRSASCPEVPMITL